MSFIYNNAVKYADTSNLDAFGRLRISNITSLLEYKHTFNKLPLIINEVTAGTATSVWQQQYAQVQMTTSSNNDYVIRQGKSRGIYQPGKGQIVETTFSNFQIQTNVIKRVGYFTTTTSAPYNSIMDGFLLESNGQTGVISFQIWQSGTSIYSAATTSWLTEDYNVTNIDWSLSQLMMVDYQWLGVGRVRFYMIIDGAPKLFATYTAANNIPYVYMSSANQPIRYEIRQVGAGSGTFNMICSQVAMEGSLNNLFRSQGLQAFNIQSMATAGTKYALLGFRLNSGSEGANVILEIVFSINTTSPSKSDYYLTIEWNPTLSSSVTFSATTNSPVEYATGGGRTVTTSNFIISTALGAGSGAQSDSFNFTDNIIRPGVNVDGTRDEIWICAVSAGNNQDFRIAANVLYHL